MFKIFTMPDNILKISEEKYENHLHHYKINTKLLIMLLMTVGDNMYLEHFYLGMKTKKIIW